MAKTLRFEGHVGTDAVGSRVTFSFSVDDASLPPVGQERTLALEEIARDALWESGKFEWGYEQTGEVDDGEEP